METLLTTTHALAKFCAPLLKHPPAWLAFDTEFVRTATYYPHVCLIQLAIPKHVVAIDVLAPQMDLQPLWQLLGCPQTLKIAHAATQDLEGLRHSCPSLKLHALFDTQVAAMLTNDCYMPSYAALAEPLIHKTLPKDMQRHPWHKRPLPEKALAYALNDVRYLFIVYQELQQQLAAKKRIAWMQEEMQALLNHQAHEVSSPWRKVKGWQTGPLKPLTLHLLHTIAAWREGEAQKRNVPRGHVLKDQAILRLIHTKCTDNIDAHIHALKVPDAQKQQWRACLETDPCTWPNMPRIPAPVPTEQLKKTKKHAAHLAKTLHIPLPFLITTRMLESVARGHIPSALQQSWRGQFLEQLLPQKN